MSKLKIVSEINQLTQFIGVQKQAQRVIGFVPTMGNLHAGHLSLVKRVKELTDYVVVSIFVNPLQFAAHEDFGTYPRTLADDLALLAPLGVDAVFTPTQDLLFPDGVEAHTHITVPRFEGKACALSRPHFFSGVATIVMKLFQLVKPDIAIFGEKDFQQLRVIQQMVKDLFMPINIISGAIVREADGLAMSSRNRYLSASERQIAPQLYATLTELQAQITEGARDYTALCDKARLALQTHGFQVDYLSVYRQSDLNAPAIDDTSMIILAAAVLGKTRLIDNIQINI